jgi:hypothetical protein
MVPRTGGLEGPVAGNSRIMLVKLNTVLCLASREMICLADMVSVSQMIQYAIDVDNP